MLEYSFKCMFVETVVYYHTLQTISDNQECAQLQGVPDLHKILVGLPKCTVYRNDLFPQSRVQGTTL